MFNFSVNYRSTDDKDLKKILESYPTIAVIGCSDTPGKDANRIPAYMRDQGYGIVPVNPNHVKVLGEYAFPSLLEIPEHIARTIEAVLLFRPRYEADKFAKEVIKFKSKYPGLKVLWMQLGIFLNDQEQDSVDGLKKVKVRLVEDRCMLVEHMRLM